MTPTVNCPIGETPREWREWLTLQRARTEDYRRGVAKPLLTRFGETLDLDDTFMLRRVVEVIRPISADETFCDSDQFSRLMRAAQKRADAWWVRQETKRLSVRQKRRGTPRHRSRFFLSGRGALVRPRAVPPGRVELDNDVPMKGPIWLAKGATPAATLARRWTENDRFSARRYEGVE